jgi:hypothetical protein
VLLWTDAKRLQPDIKIEIFERLDIAAAESSMLGITQEQGFRFF